MTSIPRCPTTRLAATDSLLFNPSAVTFDLDDTLYDQSCWLDGAWREVGQVADAAFGVPRDETFLLLKAASAAGSGRGNIINSVFPELRPEQIELLVRAFHGYRASALEPFPGAVATLRLLRSRGIPLALITDGQPAGQHNKIDALGIRSLFDVITVSDEYGREYRKPHQRPFLETARALGVSRQRIVHVGDRWEKDVRGATDAGYLGTIRIHTGEYQDVPCQSNREGFACVEDVASAGALLSS